ncbi:hypothetical protein K501DRAFT_337233 [Backusella circina FSU 941]|nr:hypothetical protein K501DRAFT_337233 [Backusella circina FSU 941]
MKEPVPKKERAIQYNDYADEDRMRYFYFLKSKIMALKEATKAANVNYDTSRKWKQAYENDPDKNIPLRKTNRTSNRPISRLNDEHKEHFSLAAIQDATDDLIKNFAGLNIKKSRVAEFMKEECNLNIKGSCVFLDEFGFDVNMHRSRGWPARGSPAIVESPTAKAELQIVIGDYKIPDSLRQDLELPSYLFTGELQNWAKRPELLDAYFKASLVIAKNGHALLTTASNFLKKIRENKEVTKAV